jgi:hypothetical protein
MPLELDGGTRVPIGLPSEQRELTSRLERVGGGDEAFLVCVLRSEHSSPLNLDKAMAFFLLVNTIAMWSTSKPVARLLVLERDVIYESPYAYANEFRALMRGGFADLRNVEIWLKVLGLDLQRAPPTVRWFSQALKLIPSTRIGVSGGIDTLTRAEWFFGFSFHHDANIVGHFRFNPNSRHAFTVETESDIFRYQTEEEFVLGDLILRLHPSRGIFFLSADAKEFDVQNAERLERILKVVSAALA